MAALYRSLYYFFESKKLALCFVIGIIVLFCGYFASQIKWKEDISNLFPADEKIEKFTNSFEDSKITDKIIFDVYNKSESTDPDRLIEFNKELIKNINQIIDSSLIKEITYKVDDKNIDGIYENIYQCLPFLLTEADYQELAENIKTDKLAEKLEGNLKNLISPAGMVLKKFLIKDPLSLAGKPLKRLQDFQKEENIEIYKGHFISKDKSDLLFFLSPNVSPRDSGPNKILIAGLDKAISKTEATFDGNIKCQYFGAAAVGVANAKRIRKDIQFTVGIAVLFLFLFVSYFFRKIWYFFLLLLPPALAAIVSLGLMGLFLGELSLISIAVGSVLLGITLDYSLHIFTHYRHKKNIDSIFDDLVQPIMMSATTTSIAFLCLLVLKSKALHELGIFAALSVLFSAIFALIILPHFASKLSAEKKIKETVLDRLASVDQSKFNWLKWPILAISILCLFFVNKVKFEDNMMELNYLSPKLEMAEKKLNTLSSASLKPIILNIEGKNLEEALQNGEEVYPILETLKSKEALHHFTALNYFYPSLAEQEKKLKQWNNFWEQQDKDKVIFELDSIGSELGFKKNSFRDFEKLLNSDLSVSHDHFSFLREMLFDDYISEKSNKTNISSILRIGTLPKESIFKELSNFESITFLDNAFLASHFAKILRSDFSRLAILSLSLSFLILLIFYGRIELAIITFIPIALSWLWTLGLMGLFGFKFNIVNIIITSFIFGLGVDYSIFIMHGLQQEHSYQKKNLASYKISIILSVLTTLTGIGVLIFAKHPALKSISALAIIGIVSVILICWVLEPILFNFLFKTKKGDRPHPITAKNFFQTLWVYAWLVGGCFLMLIIAIVLNLFFFIPLEARKNFFHRVVCFLSGLYVKLSLPFNFKFENPHKEDFKKPAMMIANHQSLIEIPLVLMHKPKSILLTNDKVYNSPLYAAITRFADFYSFSKGSEEIFEALQEKIAKGYSIIVFPEGTRSVDDQVQRFRKGAFFLAQNLELDLIPMYFHGTGNFLGKGNFFGKISPVGLRIGQRIPFTDWATEERSWSNQTKKSLKHYRTYLPSYNNEMESPDFLKNRLFENYIYKGPVLEWYMRIKTKSEAYYKFFDDLIPNKAKITDLGCGYGFMDYILMWRSEERTILGIDYDCEKIEIAQNCKAKNERIDFICGKVEEVEIPESDVIIISDVLHYLIPEQQTIVINKAIDQLNEAGMLIIRDGDSDKQGRHWGTKLTEIISTNIGFNKTQNELHFLSASFVQKIAESRNLKFELVDNTKFTSNIVCVLRKK